MRQKRSILNVIGSFGSYIVAMIFTFFTQAAIVKILGIEYSGVNGLFTNILTMLSVAELGLGTTIIYKLYEPLSRNDIKTIKSWMKFYKICYRFVALFVLVVGIVVIPFLPLIVGETFIRENLIVLYLISLLDTVLSYVMTYKRSLLYADQKNYIINIVHIGYVVLMNLSQILILLLTKNYIFYLILKICFRVLENVIIDSYVNKKYPYVKEASESLSEAERKDFFVRIRAMLVQKISFVVNKGIDNILISIFLGITMVGYYTNYNMIVLTLCGIIFQTISGLSASVGDLLTEKNSEKNHAVFRKINYINLAMTGICITGFVNCIQPFIELWIGKEYLLDSYVIISFAIYIYSDSIRRSITIFKEAAGICKEDKLMYVIMALINLLFSIILCKVIGISGVILGTSISYLFLIFYSYPKYIYMVIFKKDLLQYYTLSIRNIVLIILGAGIANVFTNLINIEGAFLHFFVNVLISVLTFIIIFILFTCKTNEFKYFKKIIFRKYKNNTQS